MVHSPHGALSSDNQLANHNTTILTLVYLCVAEQIECYVTI